MWEMEKLLITSNFSFSPHSDFKRLVMQTCKNQGLFGKGLTLFQMTNFGIFQTQFADDNFKFREYGRKFYKWVENTVGKGKIASYEQFLLFLQCFQKTCSADT